MMTEQIPADRLLRKRNGYLQKQLDLTLQILGQEYRQAKERMHKEEKDCDKFLKAKERMHKEEKYCDKFLKSLYNTVPGLQSYGHPNTRAMSTSSVLKDRRYSAVTHPGAAAAGNTGAGDDSDDGDNPNISSPRRPSPSKPQDNKSHGSKASFHDDTEKAVNVSGNSGSRSPRAVKHGTPRAARPFLRPRTAGALRGQGPARQGVKNRPATSFLHRKFRPKFGKGAYTEHDRSVHETVIKRFHIIFSPDAAARNTRLSTSATPILLEDDDDDPGRSVSSGNRNHRQDTNQRQECPSTHSHKVLDDGRDQHDTITVGGEEFDLDRRPVQGRRRVIWSARPHRATPGCTSTPNVSTVDSSSSDTSPSDISLASSGLKSSSMTQLSRARPKSETSMVRDTARRPHSPRELDPRIQALALQRSSSSLSGQYGKGSSENRSLSDSNGRGSNAVTHSAARNQPATANGRARKLSSSHIATGYSHVNGNGDHPNSGQTPHHRHRHNHNDHHHHHHSHHNHHHHYHHQNGASPRSNSPTRRTSSPLHPSAPHRRVSTAHDPTPPSHLTAKLRKPEDNPNTTTNNSNNSIITTMTTNNTNNSIITTTTTTPPPHMTAKQRKPEDNPTTTNSTNNKTNNSIITTTTTTPPPHMGTKQRKPEDNPTTTNTTTTTTTTTNTNTTSRRHSRPQQPARPRTAPHVCNKSELTHRFIPVSRKLVVGILAQIENQKASTRTMVSTSRDLKEIVKKLVPWEQQKQAAAEDSDD